MRHINNDVDILFKALANEKRRSILFNLSSEDLSLSFLAGLYGMSMSGVAKHLKILEDAKLVRSYHYGYSRRYHLQSRSALKLIEDTTIWYTTAKSA